MTPYLIYFHSPSIGRKSFVFFKLIFILLLSFGLRAQAPVEEWYFTPQYTLNGRAENRALLKKHNFSNTFEAVTYPSDLLIYKGEEPTERLLNLLPENKIPRDQFTVELFISDHVNKPVGTLLRCYPNNSEKEFQWLLGYYDNEILFSVNTEHGIVSVPLEIKPNTAYKNYFHHLVAIYNGTLLKIFRNGILEKETKIARRTQFKTNAQIELASYMENEPHMRTENLVRAVRIYDYPLNENQIHNNLNEYHQQVEKGIIYPGIFHFNAGPYLHYATQNSINLTWETDRLAHFTLEYGKSLPLREKKEINPLSLNQEKGINQQDLIMETTLGGLEPATTYFYNLKGVSESGEKIESGILTFTTAVKENEAFAFALIGDTEARPHINNYVAKQIWDERPNFLLNVGDLTDGGVKDHKFEWNYEYFQGMNQLHSRIPVFPVPGNGEDDLFWYKKYHKLPLGEDFYSFKYGNAEFFMLNSNQTAEFAPGGKQYEWLKNALQHSTAKWKFVAHHFAPYSSDEDDYGNSWEGPSNLGDVEIRKIVPLYEQYGVDMVFFGHLHTYTRTHPIYNSTVNKDKGVIYIQSGGAGGNLEDFAPGRAWFSAKTFRGHHYCIFSIADNQLSFKMFDIEGSMRDFLEITKD